MFMSCLTATGCNVTSVRCRVSERACRCSSLWWTSHSTPALRTLLLFGCFWELVLGFCEVTCFSVETYTYKSKPNSHRVAFFHWSLLHQPLYSFTSGTRTSVCFHGDLDAFTAHCKGPLCLKMPLKHNRSQQVLPAQKIKQQGTEFFIYLLFFPSLHHDLNRMGGQYTTRKETLHLKEKFWCVNLTLQHFST